MKTAAILNKNQLSKDDITHLLMLQDEHEIELLYKKADEVRKKYCGDEVHLRGIIEFSNYCEQDCLYCGLRKSNNKLKRYRMSVDEILSSAKAIHDTGIRTIVLQSGEDIYFGSEEIRDIIKSIKTKFNTAVTLSLGERSFEDYKMWKDAGADRYLLKHETANVKLYSMYHQAQSLRDRIGHLLYLKKLGYQIGSGNLIGLPFQTIEDIAEDLLLCRELDVDMASISPFIPSPYTPYKHHQSPALTDTLKTIASARIVLKDAHIPATAALSALDEKGRERGLRVGANVVMPNFTPAPYKAYYEIYPNKYLTTEDPVKRTLRITAMIESLGRRISASQGDSLKQKVLA
jgi:biotin synthase